MENLINVIYQNNGIHQKDINPGIGTYFIFIKADEYLATKPKHGAFDETGGVRIDQTANRSPVIAEVYSAVTGYMNGNSSNINFKSESASTCRESWW